MPCANGIAIENKVKQLNELKIKCFINASKYKELYKKTKKKDDRIDGIITALNASSIALIVSGFTCPPLLIVAAGLSAVAFTGNRIQEKYNFKNEYLRYKLINNQYNDLAREISTCLLRNHMSSEQYLSYIEYVNDKLSLIEDFDNN